MIAFALVGLAKLDAAQRLYDSFQSRLRASHAVEVDVVNEKYKFMGRRYRLDAEQRTIVCDGTKLVVIEHDKLIRNDKAPREWPDDMWLRGFEAIEKGPVRPQCTDLERTSFAGRAALSVDTRYSESPMFSSNLFFDAKTKLPLGYRTYSYGNLESEVIYKRVDLHAHLKAADFHVQKP